MFCLTACSCETALGNTGGVVCGVSLSSNDRTSL